MEFQASTNPIYVQIADQIFEKIIKSELKVGDKIPSVREMAADLEVNPNTIVRTFTHLENNGVIDKKRGVGYFIAKKAKEKILAAKRKDFLEHEVPKFKKQMDLLNLNIDDLNI